METVYFDWSGRALTVVWNDDPAELIDDENIRTTNDLLDLLHEPTRIISEATFDSFNLDARRAVIERAAKEGHIWLTTPNRQTGRHRDALGWDKSDVVDVQVIRDIAKTRPETLKAPVPPPSDEELASQRAANKELMILRNTIVRQESSRAKKGYVERSAKEQLARNLIEYLPKFKTLTPLQKIVLGGDKYSECIVAAVAVATKYSHNRRDFEQLAGLFGHGYPTQIRADLHFHGWSNIAKRAKRQGVEVTLSDFRREIRWLYHRMTELREYL